MKVWSLVLLASLLAGCAGMSPQAPRDAHFDGWREFRIPGKKPTRYEPVLVDGTWVVRAQSLSAASMFRRLLRIEPAELGDLSFEWQVDRLIERADLTDADLADSPVRIVLAFDGDHARLTAKNRMMFELAHTLAGETPPFATLMYVWDNKAATETIVPGGRSDRIRKIVVESGPAHAGHWRSHRRDVAADFRRAFGEEPGALIGVALLTDTDNTRAEAQARYRNVLLHDAHGGIR